YPALHYVGYFGGDSLLCYNDINLTGVKSIELEYSRGIDDPGRFAVVIHDGTGLGQYTNLGEQYTSPTGGWETFERRRIGLARQVSGRHTLCFFGVEGGGIFNLDKFSLSDQPGEHDGITWRPDAMPTVFSAAGYKFTLERVA